MRNVRREEGAKEWERAKRNGVAQRYALPLSLDRRYMQFPLSIQASVLLFADQRREYPNRYLPVGLPSVRYARCLPSLQRVFACHTFHSRPTPLGPTRCVPTCARPEPAERGPTGKPGTALATPTRCQGAAAPNQTIAWPHLCESIFSPLLTQSGLIDRPGTGGRSVLPSRPLRPG